MEAARLEAQIKREFEKLHEFLRSEETELLAQLQEETRRKHGLVEGKMKRLAEEKQVLLNEACQLQSDRKEDDYTFLMVNPCEVSPSPWHPPASAWVLGSPRGVCKPPPPPQDPFQAEV